MPTDAELGIAPAPDEAATPAPAAPVQTAPAAGSEGRTITIRPRAPPKPPPEPIAPHPSEPLAVPPVAGPDAVGQKPPTDEDLGIQPPEERSSLLGDVGKSALSGVSAGVEGLIGLPTDISHAADYGLDWAGAHVRAAATGEDPQELMKGWQDTRTKLGLDDFMPPSSAKVAGWVNKRIPMLGYQPQTGLGRYTHEFAAFAPAALVGGVSGIPARLAQTVLPSIGSETLGNLTKGTSWEPWARGLGAIIGGGVHIVGGATKDAISEYAKPITEAGQQDLAAQQFRAQTSEPDEALAKLRAAQAQTPPGAATGENITGSKPTTGQITGDLGQLGMERAVQTVSPELHAGRMASQRAAQSKALGNVQPTGEPVTVADLVRKRLADIDAEHEASVTGDRQMHEEMHAATHERMSREAARAEQQAKTAAGNVARRGDPEALGERARGALAASMAKAKEKEEALWRAIDPHNKIGVVTTKIGARARNIANNIGYQKPMEGEEKAIFDAVGGLPKGVGRLRDVMDLSSRLKTAMRQERMTNGNSPALRRMATLNTTMENVIANSATRASAAEAAGLQAMRAADRKAMQQARAATKARGNIERSPAGEIIRKGATSDSYRTMSSQVPGKVFAAGPTGGQRLKAYTAAGGTMDPVHDIVSDSLAREATTDGVIDAKKLKTWQENHRPALEALPAEIREKFLGGEADAAGALAEGAASRREALIAHSKLQVGKEFEKQLAQGSPTAKAMRADPAFKGLEGADNPKSVQGIVGNLVGRKDGIEAMQRLANEVKGDTVAADGLKRAVLDEMIEKVMGMTEAGTTGVDALKPGRAQAFIRAKREVMKAAGFSDEQLNALAGIAADIKRQQRFYATKAAGQSNTPQDLLKHLKETIEGHREGPLTNLIAIKEGIEAAHSFGIPKGVSIPAGVAIAAGKHFYGKRRNAGLKNVASIIHNAVMNPDQAEHLLSQPPKIPGRGSQAALASKWGRQAMYAGLAAQRNAGLNH